MPPKSRPGPPPASLEVFGKTVRWSVEQAGSRFTAPDDDWMPVLQMENARRELMVMLLDPVMFTPESQDGGRAKNALAAMLSLAIMEFEAVRFGLLINAWTIATDAAGVDEWSGRIHEHPDRKEVLTVFTADRDRDEMWTCDILRHEDGPPTLTPWEQLPSGYSGRWVDLREALREES